MVGKFTHEGVCGTINGHEVFAQCNADASMWRVRIRGKWSETKHGHDAETQIVVGGDIYHIQGGRRGFSVTLITKRQ